MGPPMMRNPSSTRPSMKAACASQPSCSRIGRAESQPGPWISRTAKLAMAGAYRPLPTTGLAETPGSPRATALRGPALRGPALRGPALRGPALRRHYAALLLHPGRGFRHRAWVAQSPGIAVHGGEEPVHGRVERLRLLQVG